MASRCGCAATCACVLVTDDTLIQSGNGSAESPWMLRVAPDRVAPSCSAVMDCIANAVDEPLSVDNGRLSVGVSTDDDQVLTTGSDGGLYVPGCVAGAVAIDDTATIDMSGSGQTGNPLTADWRGAATGPGTTGVQLLGTGTPDSPLSAEYRGAWARLGTAPFPLPTGVQDYIVTFSMVAGQVNQPFTLAGNGRDVVCQIPGFYHVVYRARSSNTSSIESGAHINGSIMIDGSATGYATTNIYGTTWSMMLVDEYNVFQAGQVLNIRFQNNSDQQQNFGSGSLYLVRAGAAS